LGHDQNVVKAEVTSGHAGNNTDLLEKLQKGMHDLHFFCNRNRRVRHGVDKLLATTHETAALDHSLKNEIFNNYPRMTCHIANWLSIPDGPFLLGMRTEEGHYQVIYGELFSPLLANTTN